MLHFSHRKAILQAFIRMNNATEYHLDFFSREDDFSRKSLPNEGTFWQKSAPNDATMLTVVNPFPAPGICDFCGYRSFRGALTPGTPRASERYIPKRKPPPLDLWNNSYGKGFVLRGRPGAPQRWPSTPVESFRLA